MVIFWLIEIVLKFSFWSLLVESETISGTDAESDPEPEVAPIAEPEVQTSKPESEPTPSEEPESNQTSPAEIISESEVADLEAELDNLDVDDIEVDSDVDFDDEDLEA